MLLPRTAARSCTGALLLLGAAGCWSVPERADRRTLTAWLICSECLDGELQRVLDNGERMIPYLEAALAEGPTERADSMARLQALEQVFRTNRYRASRSQTPLSSSDSTALVERQEDVFDLTYRLKAAQAFRQLDPDAAAVKVAAYCATNPPELNRRPEFVNSFKQIGNCP